MQVPFVSIGYSGCCAPDREKVLKTNRLRGRCCTDRGKVLLTDVPSAKQTPSEVALARRCSIGPRLEPRLTDEGRTNCTSVRGPRQLESPRIDGSFVPPSRRSLHSERRHSFGRSHL